jgi:hypothetical protein
VITVRKLATLSALGAAVLAGLASISQGAQSAAVKCPLKASSALPGGEAWAFTATGVPVSPHAGIKSAYVHGRGTWTHGRGAGTICSADMPASGAARDIVLSVGGAARVSPGITELGRKGVGLALNVKVSASDDPACALGTRGSVTVFASYFQGHHDRVQLHFVAGCTGENATFQGPQLHALIAREGRQVN